MKIKITTIVDVPDMSLLEGEHRIPSATQIIFDAITNYVTAKHCVDAMKWCSKAKVKEDTEEEFNKSANKTEYRLYQHHNYWADACEKLEWSYEEIK